MNFLFKKATLLVAVLLITACASKSTFEKYYSKAEAGDAYSQLVIGDEYYFGSKETVKNKELAIKYYMLAVDGGNDEAAFSLARIYQKDENFDKAVHYYDIASQAGNFKAQDNLAVMYHHGAGVEKDLEKAEELYLKALANGSKYSTRNLAVLYRDTNRPSEAIGMFKSYVFDPVSKSNTLNTKKLIAFEVMDLYLAQKDDENAYIWGGMAVLSGLFDSKVHDVEAKISRYIELTNRLTDDEKNTFAEQVLVNHYNAFVKNETAVIKREKFKIQDGLIVMPVPETVGFVVYSTQINKKLVQALNFYKDKKDKKSRLNFAIGTLRLAAYDISVGAIDIYYALSTSKIKEALAILNDYDDSNLSTLKKGVELKLDIAERVAKSQQKIKEVYLANNK